MSYNNEFHRLAAVGIHNPDRVHACDEFGTVNFQVLFRSPLFEYNFALQVYNFNAVRFCFRRKHYVELVVGRVGINLYRSRCCGRSIALCSRTEAEAGTTTVGFFATSEAMVIRPVDLTVAQGSDSPAKDGGGNQSEIISALFY